MDAVSFAVGLQSKDLRGRQLKDLIYRADGDSDAGQPPSEPRERRESSPPALPARAEGAGPQ